MFDRTQGIMLASLLKGVIKDTDGQPDAKKHRVMAGMVLSTISAVELRYVTLPVCGCVMKPL